MTPQIPGYLPAFESAVRPLVAAIALGLIWMGATRVQASAQSRYATASALSVALIVWLAIAQYLGSANTYFATTETAVPTVLFGLLIPLIAAAMGLWLSGSIASLVYAIPLPWIVAAQVYRIGGGIFLVLWADGRLPWQFALPAGIGDVTTGCFAVVVATMLARKALDARRAAYAWCLFGIADLVVAIAMGAMTSPSFCGGSDARPPRRAGWPWRDAFRLINGAGEGGQMSPSPSSITRWNSRTWTVTNGGSQLSQTGQSRGIC